MKICLYSPYIPQHFGGGEKYLLDVAVTLAKYHQVSVAVPEKYAGDATIIKKYEQFIDHDLSQVSFVPTPLGTKASAWQKLWWTRKFDVMYYLTDGSLFFSLAKRNILHIQFPLRLDKSSLIEKLKLANWQVKNTNSEFTKKIVEKSWPVKIDLVHQPLIPAKEISQVAKEIEKEKVILSVGRFFKQLHSKRQDVLVDIFRELRKKYPKLMKDWKLVLIGSVEDKNYLSEIKRKKRGLPVEFHHDIPRDELEKWYARASIYWHAAGFGVNPDKHPEKVEHFGVSTCEAMAAGCAPVVIAKGGQVEILGEELRVLSWEKKSECVTQTAELIEQPKKLIKISQQARDRSQVFGRQNFEKKLLSMIA